MRLWDLPGPYGTAFNSGEFEKSQRNSLLTALSVFEALKLNAALWWWEIASVVNGGVHMLLFIYLLIYSFHWDGVSVYFYNGSEFVCYNGMRNTNIHSGFYAKANSFCCMLQYHVTFQSAVMSINCSHCLLTSLLNASVAIAAYHWSLSLSISSNFTVSSFKARVFLAFFFFFLSSHFCHRCSLE